MMKKAVLLINLGSPKSTSLSDVRAYLAEFLMDPYVIDIPFVLRWLTVYGLILPSRPAKTKEAYDSIWTEKGSPLVSLSHDLKHLLQEKTTTPLFLAMRYAEPSIEGQLDLIFQTHTDLEHLSILPLYPHYSMSATKTAIEKVKTICKKKAPHLNLTFKESFYNDPAYIQAMANSCKSYIKKDSFILFSYHGLPVRHLRKTDPTQSHCGTPNCCSTPSKAWETCYKHQCFETTRLIAETLNLPKSQVSISFQSRLGRDPWIEPCTEDVLTTLPKQGVKNLHVICPSFVTDCLETLEEINIRGKELFIDSGGESFTYIPCMNTNEDWVESILNWI